MKTFETDTGAENTKGFGPGDRLKSAFEYEPNQRLVMAVGDFLSIPRHVIRQGIKNHVPDLGTLRIWQFPHPVSGLDWVCVNAFAANDPASTRQALTKLTELGLTAFPILGILNLRRDRADRTHQWLEAFLRQDFPEIKNLYVTGDHARAFARRVDSKKMMPELNVLPSRSPAVLMEALAQEISAPSLLLGLGNMQGLGRNLVEFWEREGSPYAA